jgi:prevent-host-death family protein
MWPHCDLAMQVAVREFKDRLSELLRRAQAGEEIVVTSRGKPVARLGPATPCAPSDPQEALRRLRSQPWLRPGDGQAIRPVVDPIPVGPADEPLLSDLMLADRE